MRDFLPLPSMIRKAANQLNHALMNDARARLVMGAMQPVPAQRAGHPAGVVRNHSRGGAAEPARGLLPVGLTLVGVCGAALLALLASRAAEPLVLTLMAGLATVGVFFLCALAARHIRFGQGQAENELFRSMIEADDTGVIVTDEAGRMVAHNAAFAALAGINTLGEVNSAEALLADDPSGSEALFRLTRAVEKGQPATEEIRLSGHGQAERWLKVSVRHFEVAAGQAAQGMRLWRFHDVTA
ncbi:MAG: PAS domain S-box protein, partial [Hyphomicrobium sp.]